MRRIATLLPILLVLLASSASAQLRGGALTVTTLPTCDTSRDGRIYSVTDATSKYVLGAGGGTEVTLVQCDGSGTTWNVLPENPSGGGSFLGNTDTPSSYSGEANNCVSVNSGETALEFSSCGSGGVTDGDKGDISVTSAGTVWNIDAGVVAATELASDAVTTVKILDLNVTTGKIANSAITVGKLDLTISPTWTGTHDFSGATRRIPSGASLPGTCTANDEFRLTSATSGQQYHICESANTWVVQGDGSSGGSSAFTGLTDTPANYTSAGGYLVKVNSGATALEFVVDDAVDAPSTSGVERILTLDDSGPTSGIVDDHGKLMSVSGAEYCDRGVIIQNAADNDDIDLGSFETAVTITSFSAHCSGCATTTPTYNLTDRAGNAMTGTATASTGTSNTTWASITAGGSLAAGEGLHVDTTTVPAPTTDDVTITVCYTVD